MPKDTSQIIEELKDKIDEATKISRHSHWQCVGRLNKLEKQMSDFKIDEQKFLSADLDELRENIGDLQRGLRNLWDEVR